MRLSEIRACISFGQLVGLRFKLKTDSEGSKPLELNLKSFGYLGYNNGSSGNKMQYCEDLILDLTKDE